jgi:hypothetical protein
MTPRGNSFYDAGPTLAYIAGTRGQWFSHLRQNTIAIAATRRGNDQRAKIKPRLVRGNREGMPMELGKPWEPQAMMLSAVAGDRDALESRYTG